MSRVKFNARMEYEYLDNFKILQKAFTRHKIEKVSLSTCFMGLISNDVVSPYRWIGSSSMLMGGTFSIPITI